MASYTRGDIITTATSPIGAGHPTLSWEVVESGGNVQGGTNSSPNGWLVSYNGGTEQQTITISNNALGKTRTYQPITYIDVSTSRYGNSFTLKEQLRARWRYNSVVQGTSLTVYLRRPETGGLQSVAPEYYEGVSFVGPYSTAFALTFIDDDVTAVGTASVTYPGGTFTYFVPGTSSKLQLTVSPGSFPAITQLFSVDSTCPLGVYDVEVTITPTSPNSSANQWALGSPAQTLNLRIVVYDIDDGFPPPNVDSGAPPDTPTDLTVEDVCSIVGDSIEVSWSAVSGATSYQVRDADTGTILYTGSGTSTTITGLTQGQAYNFQVRATNGDGSSDWSGSVSGTPDAPPATPSSLAGTLGCCGAEQSLSWSSATGADTYNLYRGGVLFASGISTTTYSVTGQNAQAATVWTVSAVNGCGESAVSAAVTLGPFYKGPVCPSTSFKGSSCAGTTFKGPGRPVTTYKGPGC
jgi:hypothetical protein